MDSSKLKALGAEGRGGGGRQRAPTRYMLRQRKTGMIFTTKLCQVTLVQRVDQMRCLIGEEVNCKHAARE